MPKQTKSILALLLLPAILLVKLLSLFPNAIEQYYSTGIYPVIAKSFRYVFGWLPFSFGDILYIVVIVLGLRWLIVNRKRMLKDTKQWCIDVLATISVVYIAFNVLWGLNYYRLPLNKTLGLNTEYSTEALLQVTKNLITKSNALHAQLADNDTTKVAYTMSKQALINQVPEGYKALSKTYNHLAYSPKSIKTSLLSVPLTYMGFSGYLNPITNEAQINSLIPAYKFPSTASHEVAHQLGYAAENEANFIGSLAAMAHPDLHFKYSGYTFALRFCLSDLYKRDPELYKQVRATIHVGILKNYSEVRAFWQEYEGVFEDVSTSTYNTFLKANSQSKGMESYSYVVALYVNYFTKYKP